MGRPNPTQRGAIRSSSRNACQHILQSSCHGIGHDATTSVCIHRGNNHTLCQHTHRYYTYHDGTSSLFVHRDSIQIVFLYNPQNHIRYHHTDLTCIALLSWYCHSSPNGWMRNRQQASPSSS